MNIVRMGIVSENPEVNSHTHTAYDDPALTGEDFGQRGADTSGEMQIHECVKNLAPQEERKTVCVHAGILANCELQRKTI